jgi:tRNA(Ile2) C34 agmatinyltransferase TiaS
MLHSRLHHSWQQLPVHFSTQDVILPHTQCAVTYVISTTVKEQLLRKLVARR